MDTEYLPTSVGHDSTYKPGDIVVGCYVVADCYERNGPCQIVSARDTSNSTSALVTIKVVHRTRVKADHYLHEVKALNNAKALDDAFVAYDKTIERHGSTFFVFPEEGVSLQWVLSNANIAPFSPRQVKEVVVQVMFALDFIHDRGLAHGDLCPSNIRFVDSSTVSESWYNLRDGYFEDRRALRCTELKISFFGQLGINSRSPLHDKYRSPEVATGLALTPKSDHFSLGCIMAELIADEPLFSDCDHCFLYVRDKLWMMENLLGDFPESVAERIATTLPNVFTEHNTIQIDDFIDPVVESWVDDHDTLQVLIRDREALAVVRSLTHHDPEDRMALWFLRQHYEYFQSVY